MEKRSITEFHFEPAGTSTNTNGPVMHFRLVSITTHEARRSEREEWRQDSSHPQSRQRVVLAELLTRGAVKDLIADGADWLAYIETGT
jgi:hypothetical protein